MAKNKRAVISAFPPHELQNLYRDIADVPVRRLSKCLDDKTVRIDNAYELARL